MPGPGAHDAYGAGEEPDQLDALLLRTATGDREAFAQLYDASAPRLYGLVVRILGESAAAEDIVQESYLDVWRHCANFRSAEGSAMGWMMTIAHRRAIDAIRSERAARRRDNRYESARESAYDTTSERAHTSLQASAVRTAVAGLNPDQQQALELVYFEGFTHLEVSQRLDVPLGTIKGRVRAALDTLRRREGRLR